MSKIIGLALAFVLCTALALPAAEDKKPSLKVGDGAPSLAVGKWIKGEPVEKLEKGKIYVVEFWATWCGPCRQTIPHVSELQGKYKDVVFIGQNCWERDDAKVAPFVEKMGDKMSYRVAMDDKSKEQKGTMAVTWMEAAGQDGIPSAFVVDKDTNIAWIGHPMELEGVLKEVVAGKFDAQAFAKKQEARKAAETKLGEALQSGDFDKALKLADEIAASQPEMADDLGMLKYQLLIQKKDPAAWKQASELADKFKDDAQKLNALAWMMVSPESPADKPDLDVAEKIATRANEVSKCKDPQVMDTLARVMFRKGNVDKAIEIQTQAIQISEDEQMKKVLQKSLDEYKAKK